jgi:aminoglycoside 2'-N-acetyltransferase I
MEFRSRLAPMATLHAAPSDALDSDFLRDLRAMLDGAFEGDFTDEDWGHAIGGVHIWLKGSQGLISHASLVERTLSSSGDTMRVGYVEAVATVAVQRHKGYAATVMTHIDELIRRRYALGALSTGTHALYESLGWERWRGPTFVDGPRGRERTPDDDGGVMILRTPRSPRLDLDGFLVCDWRPGDVW